MIKNISKRNFNKIISNRRPSYFTTVEEVSNEDIKEIVPEITEEKITKKRSRKEQKEIIEEINQTNMGVENIDKMEAIAFPPKQTVKVKKSDGLIERVESSKILITEDNKQILMD